MTDRTEKTVAETAREIAKNCDVSHILDGLGLAKIGMGNSGGCACDKCIAEAITSERRAAREKLERYGQHKDDCGFNSGLYETFVGSGKLTKVCTCGLEEALKEMI